MDLTTDLAMTVIGRIWLTAHFPGDRSTQTASVCYHILSTRVSTTTSWTLMPDIKAVVDPLEVLVQQTYRSSSVFIPIKTAVTVCKGL